MNTNFKYKKYVLIMIINLNTMFHETPQTNFIFYNPLVYAMRHFVGI